ncbi:DUF1858 domain-containing protein [bacterium]|nr:DUF1858 domain-containing protein [bacterium]
MKKIAKETKLSEILKNQKFQEILAKYNLPCLNCPMAKFEMENLTLGRVCKMYGIDNKKLLVELNKK